MNNAFAARIAIDTPLAIRKLLHLDGLLGAVKVSHGEDPYDLPLMQTSGVWHASAAVLETGVFGLISSSQKRLKYINADAVTEGLFAHLPGPRRRIGQMSPYRNTLSNYPLIEGVFAVWFVGRGNREETQELLTDLRGLGAMSQTGYGHITDVETMELEDQHLAGIALPNGLPARTVPIDVWTGMGLQRHDDAVVSRQRTAAPYWAGPEVACFMPMQIDLTGTRRTIASLIGLT